MAGLQQFPAKICLTVAGCLIHEDRVLLVKHKKLGIWLNPGGHIEANELPHKAAEREFFEETGVKVRARHITPVPLAQDRTEFMPHPFLTNLHWISRENYEKRLKNAEDFVSKTPEKRVCEQHLNFLYLVEPVGSVEFVQNKEETDGIDWFSREELGKLDLLEDIHFEISTAFEIIQRL